MAAPSMTFNSVGNVYNNSIGANANANTGTVDFSTKFEGQLQFNVVAASTPSGTNGLQVSVYPVVAGGTTQDNQAGAGSFTIPAATTPGNTATVKVGPGKYIVNLKNLDASVGITVTVTSATVDSIA